MADDTHPTGIPPATSGPLATGTEAPPPGEHGFPPFQKDTFASQLLWLAVTFGLLYLIASKLALPRVGGIIAARRERIAGDLADAARMKEAADAAIANYERSLADARTRAQAMAAEGRAAVDARSEARRHEVEAALQAKLAEAEKTIAAKRKAAMANVNAIASDAAAAIVTRLTGKAPPADATAEAVKVAVDREGA